MTRRCRIWTAGRSKTLHSLPPGPDLHRVPIARGLIGLGAFMALAVWLGTSTRAVGPRFFPDDPVAVDPETQNADSVKPRDLSQEYDFIENTFKSPGDRRNVRALNVNTTDEVPDSSWYTNRIGTAAVMSVEDIVRGPFRHPGPSEGTWTIVGGKSEGISPGMRARDASGTLYYIKFDPPSNPEMATGAEAVSTRFFYALGYHTAENHIAYFHRKDLVIEEGATVWDDYGRNRLMTQGDLDVLLGKAARGADDRYRVIASRALEGTDLGPFKYYGTRLDDPNDIFEHEHRRELRGLRVFCAWLNHDDSRSINTRDFLVEDQSRRIVRHYLIDFGSTLGSGSTQAQRPRAGNEYIWEGRPTLLTMLTFGFYVRPWIKVKYPNLPSIGRFEAEFFEPDKWKPEYPNPAFDNSRPDDEFWAARRLMALSDEAIRAVVRTGQYSDPEAESYLAETLISRRDKIGQLWLNGVLPLVDCKLADTGSLSCTNVAVETKTAQPPDEYGVRWYRFDNQGDSAHAIGDEIVAREPRFTASREVLDGNEFLMAEIRGKHPQHAGWATPMKVYLRHTANGWQTVGVDRM
jgi:hypothetical protein